MPQLLATSPGGCPASGQTAESIVERRGTRVIVPRDFHRIVHAESAAAARAAYTAFECKWTPRCPGVVRSLQEGGEELLTFFRFPKRQWKTLRTTNVIDVSRMRFRSAWEGPPQIGASPNIGPCQVI